MIIFPLLHILPLLIHRVKVSAVGRTDHNIIYYVKVIHTFTIALFLSSLENYISSPLIWYIVCCTVHVANNFIYFRNVHNKIVYNEEQSNGFVLKLG